MTVHIIVHPENSGRLFQATLSCQTFLSRFWDENILKPSREPIAWPATNPRSFCVIMAGPLQKRWPNPAESCFTWFHMVDKAEHAIFLEGSIASSASYVQRLEGFSRPRVLKSHVPADMHPGLARGEGEILQEHGKVLYVVRNPKDAMISLRHHHANNAAIGWDGSWDEWVRQWLSGERSAEYGGSYFDHVKKWWKLAKLHPDRIRIVYFEEMKADLSRQVAQVADFLGLSLSSEQLQKVCDACRFESMRSRHQVADDIRSEALRAREFGVQNLPHLQFLGPSDSPILLEAEEGEC
eukprot:s2379_g8.t1